MNGKTLPDGSRDFDFLMGDWRILNRKRRDYWAEEAEWEEFEASMAARPLPGGIGNYDSFESPGWRPGFTGMSLRVYSPVTRLWSIYWLSNRDGGLDPQTGSLLPPVVGSFIDGVGIFEGDDELEGHAIRVRYTWTLNGPGSASWQQAFSRDGGQSWATNWRMDMQRTTAAVEV